MSTAQGTTEPVAEESKAITYPCGRCKCKLPASSYKVSAKGRMLSTCIKCLDHLKAYKKGRRVIYGKEEFKCECGRSVLMCNKVQHRRSRVCIMTRRGDVDTPTTPGPNVIKKYHCNCGSVITRLSIKPHRWSKKHRTWMAKNGIEYSDNMNDGEFRSVEISAVE